MINPVAEDTVLDGVLVVENVPVVVVLVVLVVLCPEGAVLVVLITAVLSLVAMLPADVSRMSVL